MPVLSVVADAFDRLVAAGGGDLDHSAFIILLEDGRADVNAATYVRMASTAAGFEMSSVSICACDTPTSRSIGTNVRRR